MADPADTGQSYANNLQRLVKDFPQSGLLQALLARSDSEQSINHAAAYFDPRLLYSLTNSPGSLAVVNDDQIIQELSDTVEYASATMDTEHNLAETVEATVDEPATEEHADIEAATNVEYEEVQELTTGETEPAIEEHADVETATNVEHEQVQERTTEDAEPVIEEHEEIQELPATETEHPHEDELVTMAGVYEEEHLVEAVELSADVTEPITITPENEHFYEDELVTEAGADEVEHPAEAIEPSAHEAEPVQELSELEEHKPADEGSENIQKDEPVSESDFFKLDGSQKDIDDDVYDEIVGIENINFTSVSKPAEDTVQPDIHPSEETNTEIEELTGNVNNEPAAETGQKERALNLDDEAEKLIVGNIAATDYFVFDRAVSERKQAEAVESDAVTSPSHAIDEVSSAGAEKQDVSKYHDEKMPYTFMWWLDKTRKEHAGIYQPFKLDTTQAIRQSGAEELQQQYYENIFHINSVEELDRSISSPTVEFDTKRKEDVIIKRFITEEPHIRPPSIDKLDTENKAKKSAEDQDEMVTETLARVYSDQMLYHKAINTYKKLMLKFPEKSRYFADQIEQLERKTN